MCPPKGVHAGEQSRGPPGSVPRSTQPGRAQPHPGAGAGGEQEQEKEQVAGRRGKSASNILPVRRHFSVGQFDGDLGQSSTFFLYINLEHKS